MSQRSAPCGEGVAPPWDAACARGAAPPQSVAPPPRLARAAGAAGGQHAAQQHAQLPTLPVARRKVSDSVAAAAGLRRPLRACAQRGAGRDAGGAGAGAGAQAEPAGVGASAGGAGSLRCVLVTAAQAAQSARPADTRPPEVQLEAEMAPLWRLYVVQRMETALPAADRDDVAQRLGVDGSVVSAWWANAHNRRKTAGNPAPVVFVGRAEECLTGRAARAAAAAAAREARRRAAADAAAPPPDWRNVFARRDLRRNPGVKHAAAVLRHAGLLGARGGGGGGERREAGAARVLAA
jgi:hypothetical protein